MSSDERDVRALEAANILPGAIFARENHPVGGTIVQRHRSRHAWFETVQHTLDDADLVFLDPDNGLEPAGYSLGSAKGWKSILLSELRALARPGRCLIVYHHHTLRQGGHHVEIEYWADRLRECGFATVDALRARPYSPRVFFLLDAPADVRQRAEQIEVDWRGCITWHPDRAMGGGSLRAPSEGVETPTLAEGLLGLSAALSEPMTRLASAPKKSGRRRSAGTIQVGYVNRNGQEVVRSAGKAGTDHGQYVYALRCRTCGHEYGANGSDIFLRRCPAHD